jgi:hypothetical protein
MRLNNLNVRNPRGRGRNDEPIWRGGIGKLLLARIPLKRWQRFVGCVVGLLLWAGGLDFLISGRREGDIVSLAFGIVWTFCGIAYFLSVLRAPTFERLKPAMKAR